MAGDGVVKRVYSTARTAFTTIQNMIREYDTEVRYVVTQRTMTHVLTRRNSNAGQDAYKTSQTNE